MKKIFVLMLTAMLVLGLAACGSADSPAPAEEQEVEEMNADKVKEIICSVADWTYTSEDGNEGHQSFFDDDTGYLKVNDIVFEGITYAIDEDLVVKMSFSYNGTNYSSSYRLEETDAGYQLVNVSHPETIWVPAE